MKQDWIFVSYKKWNVCSNLFGYICVHKDLVACFLTFSNIPDYILVEFKFVKSLPSFVIQLKLNSFYYDKNPGSKKIKRCFIKIYGWDN